ncbi:hypothetical protein ACO0LO_23685 [Undibacterium sp. TJN25]|uniref:hypothetical protein n=1 Tax=Undibacterium sp. TJN25 TaxID=3413056 RepID=UPI003BF207DC
MHAPLTDPSRHPAYRPLYAAAAVLERFIAAHAREIGLRQIIAGVRFSEADVKKACRALLLAGLIMPGSTASRWALAVDPGQITLADVWQAIAAGDGSSKALSPNNSPPDGKTDLLVSQALLSVEPQFIAHLSRFRLDTASHAQTGFQYVNYRARRKIRFAPPPQITLEISAVQVLAVTASVEELEPA